MKLEFDCSTGEKSIREHTDEEIAIKNLKYTDEYMLNVELPKIRRKRNSLLTRSDWTQMPDSPLTEEDKILWATYRQQLRDLPEGIITFEEAVNVVFPQRPE